MSDIPRNRTNSISGWRDGARHGHGGSQPLLLPASARRHESGPPSHDRNSWPCADFNPGGIALGLLLLVPLGDMVERRKLIVGLAFGVAGALGLAVVAFNTTLLLASALLIGVFASVSQLIVGLAASLAIPSQRGRNRGYRHWRGQR